MDKLRVSVTSKIENKKALVEIRVHINGKDQLIAIINNEGKIKYPEIEAEAFSIL